MYENGRGVVKDIGKATELKIRAANADSRFYDDLAWFHKRQGTFEEALAALQALGYQPGEILPRLRKVSSGDATAQELIRLVLREMVGR